MRSRPSDLSLALLLALIGAACSEPAPSAGEPDAGGASDAPLEIPGECSALAQKPDGSCCADGAFYERASLECVPVGPPECATTNLSASASCTPRWCWDWQGDAGEACGQGDEGCQRRGRRCSADELEAGAGCLAGEWPGGEGESCIPVGAEIRPRDALTPGTAGPLPPLADLTTPRWCWQSDDCTPFADGCETASRACSRDELAAGAGCPAGTWPSPAAQGACVVTGSVASGASEVDTELDPTQLPEIPPLGSPRWCWDTLPDGCEPFTEGCELAPRVCGPGESGCPAGEVPDGPDCRPAGGETGCPEGFLPDESTGCAPDPAACGTDPWPAAPDGAPVVFVDAAAPAAGADGTQATPYATLAAAIDAAPEGAYLLLAAGTYNEQLVVGTSVTIRGRCAAMVTLTYPSWTFSTAGAGEPVRLENLTLCSGTQPAIWLDQARPLIMRGVHVSGAGQIGVFVDGADARAEVYESVVSGTRRNDGQGLGWSVRADGGELRLVGSRVHGGHGAAVSSGGAGGELIVEDVLIDATAPNVADGLQGYALASLDGSLRAAGVRVRDVHSAVAAFEASAISAAGLHYADPDPGDPASESYAAHAIHGGRLSLLGVHLAGGYNIGLNASAGGELSAASTLVQDIAAGGRAAGLALRAWDGGVVHLQSVRLSHTAAGVLVSRAVGAESFVGDPAHLSGVDVLVDAIGSEAFLVQGEACTVDLAGSRVTGSSDYGVWSWLSASARFVGTLIDGTVNTPLDPYPGLGAGVTHEAALELTATRVSANTGIGVLVSDSVLEGDMLVIDGTVPQDPPELPSPSYGYGLQVLVDGRATLRRSRLSGNHGRGALLTEGGQLVASGLTVDRTQPVEVQATPGNEPGWMSTGIIVRQKSTLELHGARLSQNHGFGLWLTSDSGVPRAYAEGLLVDETLPIDPTYSYWSDDGNGIHLWKQGLLELVGARLAGNVRAGVSVWGDFTQLDATGLVVDGTMPEHNPFFEGPVHGVGVVATRDSEVRVKSALLLGNHLAGAHVEISKAIFDGVVISSTGVAGYVDDDLYSTITLADGIVGAAGAALTLRDVIAVDNPRSGVLLTEPAEEIRGLVTTGNGIGLVLPDADQVLGSATFGNDDDLRTPEGLPVPKPPDGDLNPVE